MCHTCGQLRLRSHSQNQPGCSFKCSRTPSAEILYLTLWHEFWKLGHFVNKYKTFKNVPSIWIVLIKYLWNKWFTIAVCS